MIPNECIIIGGGKSIQEGISLGLKEYLKNKFVITCNYSYKHFPYTFMIFMDKDFYVPIYAKKNEYKNKYPDIYEKLKSLPLIVGINQDGIEEFKLDNTILLNKKEKDNASLTGIFALEQAIKLGAKTIFLLGFDWNRRLGLPERDPNYNPYTDLQIHYYSKEEINHRGIGYTGYYENHNPDKLFRCFVNPSIKIYNVSLESNITIFEKISYHTMFGLLNKIWYNQEEIRQNVRDILCTL